MFSDRKGLIVLLVQFVEGNAREFNLTERYAERPIITKKAMMDNLNVMVPLRKRLNYRSIYKNPMSSYDIQLFPSPIQFITMLNYSQVFFLFSFLHHDACSYGMRRHFPPSRRLIRVGLGFLNSNDMH